MFTCKTPDLVKRLGLFGILPERSSKMLRGSSSLGEGHPFHFRLLRLLVPFQQLVCALWAKGPQNTRSQRSEPPE